MLEFTPEQQAAIEAACAQHLQDCRNHPESPDSSDGPAVFNDSEPVSITDQIIVQLHRRATVTNQHSLTMLSDLIEQLESDIDCYEISTSQALARAYAAGADQQLELDAKWLDHNALNEAHLKITPIGEVLKEAMRPKPPSLKEQALAEITQISIDPETGVLASSLDTIRRALESLPD